MSQSETKTYTFGEMEVLKARLVLAEHEIECLRSVLSEFDTESDKSEFVQMNRANILRDARETL